METVATTVTLSADGLAVPVAVCWAELSALL